MTLRLCLLNAPFRRIVLLVALLAAAPTAPARADILDWFAHDTISDLKKYGTQLVKDFLAGTKVIADDLVTKGAAEGNLLRIQAGNELAVLAATASSSFGTELNTSIDHASTELMPLLDQIDRFRQVLDRLNDTTIELENLVYLDLESVLSRIPGTGEPPLAVRQITGLSLARWLPDSGEITLIGLDFGTGSDVRQTEFEVKLDGVALAISRRDKEHEIRFAVDWKRIDALRSDTEIKTVALTIDITRRTKRSLSWLRGDLVQRLPLDLKVALLPDQVGTLTVKMRRPLYDWKAIAAPQRYTVTLTGDRVVDYRVPNPALTGLPTEGQMKLDDRVDVSCASEMVDFRYFPNGKRYRAKDPIFRDGFSTPVLGDLGGYVFYAAFLSDFPPRIDLPRLPPFVYERVIREKFGIDPQHYGRIAGGQYKISAQELLSLSTLKTEDVTGCRDMKAMPPTFEYADSHASVLLTGKPNVPATWTVTFHPLTYTKISTKSDTCDVPVRASQFIEFDVDQAATTSVTLAFKPNTGAIETIVLGESSKHFIYGKSKDQGGGTVRHIYSYVYPRRS